LRRTVQSENVPYPNQFCGTYSGEQDYKKFFTVGSSVCRPTVRYNEFHRLPNTSPVSEVSALVLIGLYCRDSTVPYYFFLAQA